MSEEVLHIKYRCLHPSCVVNCREGDVDVEKGLFEELSTSYDEEGVFKSPKGVCRMGFSQPFKVLSMEKASAEKPEEAPHDEAAGEDDPIKVLMDEHQVVLKLLDDMDSQLRIRDMDALWETITTIENDIILHSIKKEEEVMMPLLKDVLPMGEGLITIVAEDHREMISLLHAFKKGLAEDEILDGLAMSIATNLKSHIRKEDNEFFELVEKSLDPERRKMLFEGMEEVERTHVPQDQGTRKDFGVKTSDEKAQRELFEEQIKAIKDLVNVDTSSCCHGEHGEH